MKLKVSQDFSSEAGTLNTVVYNLGVLADSPPPLGYFWAYRY